MGGVTGGGMVGERVWLARWSGKDTVTGGIGIKCWWSVGVWKGAERGQSGEEWKRDLEWRRQGGEERRRGEGRKEKRG